MAQTSRSPQPPMAFDRGEDYKRLCSLVVQSKPDFTLEEGSYAVAMLPHDKDVTNCVATDFMWLKVLAKHTIAKLLSNYAKRTGLDVDFRCGKATLSETTRMHSLCASNKDFIILTAHSKVEPKPEPSSSGTPSARAPLNSLTSVRQLPASSFTPTPDRKPVIKSENDDPLNVHRALVLSPRKDKVRVKSERALSPTPVAAPARHQDSVVKNELPLEDPPVEMSLQAVKKAQRERLQELIEEGTPDLLEAEVRDMQILLEAARKPLATMVSEHQDAKHWVTQIDNLLKHKVDTPTVIGVVGNTGAGKSSVINALLEEERLVPTNCMRACTAVVTEMSYNSSDKPQARYRAEIEFIKAADWKKDLELSFSELLDSSGNVSRDCTNEESEAGVAYAKIKAVYPQKTHAMLVECTIDHLLNEPAVKRILGTTMTIERPQSDTFYRALQNIIDSKEKKKGEKKEMEFWPLIKVVKLYTKADALSTGAIIVDLPGVHDSNPARAAVAAGYMKQCTGLFIVAPINRAVDDKAAKSLLGESFKRQLKFDGTYSRITFICSKTDDISITEASDSLGLEDEVGADWDRINEIEKKIRELKKSTKEIKDSRQVYQGIMDDCDDKIAEWEELRDKVESGKKVWAPKASKKRKREVEAKKLKKKAKTSRDSGDEDDDDFIDDDDEQEEEEGIDEDDDVSKSGSDSEDATEPLTSAEVEEKIEKFKTDRKRARTEKLELDAKAKENAEEAEALDEKKAAIEAAVSAVCIAGRNTYSRGAIQRDFADGIRELDMENAQEEDPDAFDPEDQIRDYDEVARSLPLALETRYLKTKLLALEKSLQISVKTNLTEMNQALAEHIFENYDEVVDIASEDAPNICRKWHRPVNRDDRAAGGFYWATYKAIMRREGVFSNAQGTHDFNTSLAEPIIKNLASHWERVFAQRLPRVLQAFTRQSKNHLTAFHREIEARSTKLGLGVAGLGLLGEQLRNYEGIFTTLSSQMLEMINGLQREANREFTPVICRKLESAYAFCAAESGGGQFVRMKVHMEAHIDHNREAMFRDSVNEVKKRLDQMCEQVEENMLARSDEVYTMMSRDYLSVMGGSQLPDGEVMPRWERKMRADVLECIQNRDAIISQVRTARLEAKLAEKERIAEEERVEAERVAAREQRQKDEEKARKKRKADEAKAARKQKADDEKAAKLAKEEAEMKVEKKDTTDKEDEITTTAAEDEELMLDEVNKDAPAKSAEGNDDDDEIMDLK